jgi:ribosomal protein S18 acetylase RimI-like enzyme
MKARTEVSSSIRIRAIRDSDRDAVLRILTHSWGSGDIVTRGRIHHAHAYPGFVAVAGNCIVGLVTYHIRGGRCEVVSLDSFWEGRGVGTRLLRATERLARASGCHEAWLVTTNDNLRALAFYQKRGWRLRRIHAGAIARSRALKPSIPLVGMDEIPLRDEIELTKPLIGRGPKR